MTNGILFSAPKKLSKSRHLNLDTGFLLRRVYGETEYFTYHTHEYYEIFLTISGTIIHHINGTVQSLEPGCLVFIRPDDRHIYEYHSEKNYSFVNLALDPEIIDGMFFYLRGIIDSDSFCKCKMPPVVRLTSNEMHNFLKQIDILNTLQQEETDIKKLKIRSFLLDTFINYFTSHTTEIKYEIPFWLESTYEKMKKPHNFIMGSDRMVEISGKSREHLARCMKKYYNITLSGFINELRLNYAVNLILNTNLKITDICYESGFGNLSVFYTLFTQTYGVAPKKFRDEKRNI